MSRHQIFAQKEVVIDSEDLTLFGTDDTSFTYNGVPVMGQSITSLAPIGSSPNASGASIASHTLTLQPASATFGGVLTSGVQSIAGAKTFTNTITAANLSGTNTGDLTITPVGGSPNASGGSIMNQALQLSEADGTNPGLLSASTQTIGGAKTFAADVTVQSNIVLPSTITSGAGNLTKGSTRVFSTPSSNIFIGENTGNFNVTTGNVIVGGNAGLLLANPADNNTAAGDRSLDKLTIGTDNTCYGADSGSAYTSNETRNLCLANTGVIGDNNTIRIGNTLHTSCYVQGIDGVTVAGGSNVLVNASGLLGTVLSSKQFKEEIEDIPESDMVKFYNLQPKRFKMIADPTKEQQWGVIAEQAEDVGMTDLVIKNKLGEIQTFQYQKLDGFYIKALKDIKSELEAEKSRVDLLKQAFDAYVLSHP